MQKDNLADWKWLNKFQKRESSGQYERMKLKTEAKIFVLQFLGPQLSFSEGRHNQQFF